MLEQFLRHIESHHLCKREDSILLAVSGGIDSMVMLHLFRKAGYSVAVAHCNFQLRGSESDADETLVKNTCSVSGIPFHLKRFDTDKYVKERGTSLQVAARELRYSFFNELMEEHDYSCVATAHHLDDSLETTLLNLVRGTGLDGLSGIPVRNDRIIRPMLFASRKMIEAYATLHDLAWREDQSNVSDNYARNVLRHHVVPVLRKINPNLTDTFSVTMERVQAAKSFIASELDRIKKNVAQIHGDMLHINSKELKRYPWSSWMLWEMLKDYGFNYDQCKSIIATNQSGKIFHTELFQLTVDRDQLLLGKRNSVEYFEVTVGEQARHVRFGDVELTLDEIDIRDFTLEKNPEIAQLDSAKIKFPCTWRSWKEGDHFVPLGMLHHKKISDFLIDAKVPMTDKAKVTVLEAGREIIWVVGYRIGDQFKVSDNTKRVLRIRRKHNQSNTV